ncbi:MAG: FAD binding domain-containing protein [Casimicrobiaceae bacterium]
MLALDANVELLTTGRIETLPLAEFLVGNRRTRRRPEQLVAAIVVPKPVAARAAGHFRKLGSRRYLVISFVMVGAALAVDDKRRIVTARVAVGACSPVARRLPLLEAALLGQAVNPSLSALVERDHLAPIAPISDLRADADYRRDAALTLVRRTLDELAARL